MTRYGFSPTDGLVYPSDSGPYVLYADARPAFDWLYGRREELLAELRCCGSMHEQLVRDIVAKLDAILGDYKPEEPC